MEAVVENCGNLRGSHSSAREALAACSGCAGDYEDPERSAWTADDSEVTNDEASSERESHDTSQSADDQGNLEIGKAIEVDRWMEKQK